MFIYDSVVFSNVNDIKKNVQLINAKPRKVELDGGFFSSAPYEACRVQCAQEKTDI